MSTFFNDIKYGVRQMRKNPGFTVTAVIVLSLAIGGTTAMFTLVNALLLRPLPVNNPNQLVRLYAEENKPGGAYRSFSYPNMVDIRRTNDTFSHVSGFTITLLGITEGDITRRTMAAMVPANYFGTFGVSMASGRAFSSGINSSFCQKDIFYVTRAPNHHTPTRDGREAVCNNLYLIV